MVAEVRRRLRIRSQFRVLIADVHPLVLHDTLGREGEGGRGEGGGRRRGGRGGERREGGRKERKTGKGMSNWPLSDSHNCHILYIIVISLI